MRDRSVPPFCPSIPFPIAGTMKSTEHPADHVDRIHLKSMDTIVACARTRYLFFFCKIIYAASVERSWEFSRGKDIYVDAENFLE